MCEAGSVATMPKQTLCPLLREFVYLQRVFHTLLKQLQQAPQMLSSGRSASTLLELKLQISLGRQTEQAVTKHIGPPVAMRPCTTTKLTPTLRTRRADGPQKRSIL